MKVLLYILILFSGFKSFGQANNSNPEVEIIKVHQDSIASAISQGPLSFLNNPDLDGWFEDFNVNGVEVPNNYQHCVPCFKDRLLKAKKGNLFFLKNIKVKNSTGKLSVVGSKRIEII